MAVLTGSNHSERLLSTESGWAFFCALYPNSLSFHHNPAA